MYIVLKHLVLKYMFNYNVNNEHFTLEKNDIMRRTISWECIPIIEFAKNKKEYCLIVKYFLSRIQEWLVLWLQCVQWVTHHQKVSTELQGLEAGCILCSEHCITEYQQYYERTSSCFYFIYMYTVSCMSTIEPVLSSTILSSHLVLNIWSSKFQICFPLITVTVIFTSINWSPL